jgi:hypothetical protein
MNNKELLSQTLDKLTEGEDASSLLSQVIAARSKQILGLTEEDSIRIKGDDVLMGNKKLGSFTAEGDQIEFTDTEGNTKTFDNDEEMIGYLSGVNENLNEDKKTAEKRKDDRVAKVHGRPHDTDSKVGDYVKHELSKHHRDDRMENPSDHDHGHDDPSGKKPKEKGSSKSGSNPPDKEKDLKNKEHSAESEYKDHGHDDASGVEDNKKKGSKSGSNPPDKEKDLKNKEHKAESEVKDHGHDSPTSGKDKVKANKKG